MASCGQILQLISRELDQDLSPQELEELTAHLAQCPECRTLRQQLTQVNRAMAQLDEMQLPAPPQLVPGVMDRIREESGRKPHTRAISLPRRPQFRVLAGMAACAVLCVGLLRLSPLQPPSSDRTGDDISGQSLPDTPQTACVYTASDNGSDGEAAPSLRTASAPEAALYSAAKVAPEEDNSLLTTLILPQLPQDSEELLEGAQWIQQEDGSTSCTVPVQALEQLLQLAREQDLALQYLPQDSGADIGLFVLSPQ